MRDPPSKLRTLLVILIPLVVSVGPVRRVGCRLVTRRLGMGMLGTRSLGTRRLYMQIRELDSSNSKHPPGQLRICRMEAEECIDALHMKDGEFCTRNYRQLPAVPAVPLQLVRQA